ncbi:hypothetical protein [Ralstonia solanacearum]|uniref:Uncharacterized protein n=1 Tax=Ralstonia solanacearum TaxID=305 RepID=A0AAE3NQJ8_RALSL|nr:hypothetical protein [Ralstonia solanacearum]MBB6581565.1 hypothetical protein [Ralstonia solanacearum]MDB0524691.1 hypothetical protein [Ralstonia solanacearum]
MRDRDIEIDALNAVIQQIFLAPGTRTLEETKNQLIEIANQKIAHGTSTTNGEYEVGVGMQIKRIVNPKP